ncbi:MAG: AIM24 family protein [Halobacterium sp.]
MDATVEDGVDGALVAALESGESVLAAAGALLDYTGEVRVERAREGALRSVANAARQVELTPVRVTAESRATVRFAPGHHGELVACDASDRTVSVARPAFLAAPGDVDVSVDRVGNAPDRGVGLFLTSFAGATVYAAGRGRVERFEVEGERVVAADHVVAFDDRADVSVRRLSAVEDATAVCRVRGPGAVWVATRRAGSSAN